jgi:cytochrome oxidase Cu insertion factor (SCO1/SenC/PrrC family)
MRLRFIVIYLLVSVLAACNTVADISEANPAPASTNSSWLSIELVNAASGESFSLDSLAGKTVFVEPMATWCSNCRAQQGEVAQAMATLGTDDYVFISVSVESNVSNADLAAYAARNEFPQVFVVASSELLEAWIAQFGRTVLNPPSTPHFVIAPDGTVGSLNTGQHSATALIEELSAING